MQVNTRDSRIRAVVSGTVKKLRRALSGASATAMARRAQTRTRAAVADSVAGGFLRAITRAVRASWLYRWLTAEPDPEVIVIELRETAIVGPLLGILDWLLVRLLAHWGGSVLSGITDRSLGVLRARPIQVISTAALAGITATLVLEIVSGTPSASAVGVRLLGMSLTLAGTRLTYSTAELAETRIYDVIVALLEPPEPPETSGAREENR